MSQYTSQVLVMDTCHEIPHKYSQIALKYQQKIVGGAKYMQIRHSITVSCFNSLELVTILICIRTADLHKRADHSTLK